jgi:class 3 adenylate cyclase
MIRLSIRAKIMAIAVGLIVPMGVAAVLSMVMVVQVGNQLEKITDSYIPAYGDLARTNIRSLERALALRRMVFEKMQTPFNADKFAAFRDTFNAKGEEVEHEAAAARAVIKGLIEAKAGDVTKLALLEGRVDAAMNDARRHLIVETGRLLPLLDAGDARAIADTLDRVDVLRDELNQKLDAVRADMMDILHTATAETARKQDQVMLITAVLAVLAAILGLLFALFVSSGVTRPVQRLLAGTRAVESGHLGETLVVTSRDEIGSLTAAFNRMVEQLRLKERISETFGKFVDPRIVANMISGTEEHVDRRVVTVFFSDIAGFTSISEQLTPAAIVNLLNHYFSAVTAPIRASNGIVDKYMGDGVLAFWTAPFSPDDTHAAAACLAALLQQEATQELNKDLPNILGLRRAAPTLRVHMGIATGETIVGTIGSATAKSFTVIGDTVNLASRLEGANKIYGTKIIITEETLHLAREEVECRELDLITVVGKSEPVRIYELLAARGALAPGEAELRDEFGKGLAAYRAREWDAAERQFRRCLELRPEDRPSALYAERIAIFRNEAPPANWDGVWHLTKK